MNCSSISIVCVLLATLTVSTPAGESIFDQLRLGSLTPEGLDKLYPGTRTEIPKGNGQRVVHFQDDRGTMGVCRFIRNRLFMYTVTLPQASPPAAADHNDWAVLVKVGITACGEPKLRTASVATWDLENIYFSISREDPDAITITMRDKQWEQTAERESTLLQSEPTTATQFVHGDFYYLSGFRPGMTRKVTLTEGSYFVEARHKGRGNFIVYMHSATSQDLVANEIGTSYDCEIIEVAGPSEEVFFFVKDAGGPWEIRVKKVIDPAP